ncbi:MAG: hypothetical protein U9R08_03000 [Nanoarchaeota archaeon]|nr:hypothetical protein [Nanoarchaeota archaeon]
MVFHFNIDDAIIDFTDIHEESNWLSILHHLNYTLITFGKQKPQCKISFGANVQIKGHPNKRAIDFKEGSVFYVFYKLIDKVLDQATKPKEIKPVETPQEKFVSSVMKRKSKKITEA